MKNRYIYIYYGKIFKIKTEYINKFMSDFNFVTTQPY